MSRFQYFVTNYNLRNNKQELLIFWIIFFFVSTWLPVNGESGGYAMFESTTVQV